MNARPLTERVHVAGIVPHVLVQWIDKGVTTGSISLDLATGRFTCAATTWDAISRMVTIYYLAMEERALWLAELSAENPPTKPALGNQ